MFKAYYYYYFSDSASDKNSEKNKLRKESDEIDNKLRKIEHQGRTFLYLSIMLLTSITLLYIIVPPFKKKASVELSETISKDSVKLMLTTSKSKNITDSLHSLKLNP